MTKNKKTTYINDITSKDYFNVYGYRIGQFKEGIYRKEFKGSIHIVRKYAALGIDTKVINEIKGYGCYEIRARNVEDNKIYTISLADFIEYAIPDNLGHGNQLFCPLDKFTTK